MNKETLRNNLGQKIGTITTYDDGTKDARNEFGQRQGYYRNGTTKNNLGQRVSFGNTLEDLVGNKNESSFDRAFRSMKK